MKLIRYLLLFFICLLTLAGLSACGSALPAIKPYKLDIQQGNVVTSKMLLQLKPGMTKSQVRYIMGTPLIVDSFHKDRWDYFYQMRQAGKIIEQRRVILDFEKDALARVRGDVVPQGTSGAATGDVIGSTTTADMLKEKEDTNLLDKLKFWKSDKKPVATPTDMEQPMETTKAAETRPADAAKVPEKSWTDKLKFWKKDDAVSVTKPVEATKAMVQEPAAPSPAVEVPSEEAPSVLAVPIGAEVFTAPQAEVAPVKAEPAPESAPVIAEPVPEKVEPSKPEPKVEAVKVIPPAPTKPAPIKAAQPMSSSKPGERLIFRLDRTLKTELLNDEAPPKEAEPVIEKPVAEVPKPKKKAVEEPLPPETEPTFFDRMLEKIGF